MPCVPSAAGAYCRGVSKAVPIGIRARRRRAIARLRGMSRRARGKTSPQNREEALLFKVGLLALGARELQEAMDVTDDEFESLPGYDHPSPRDFYVYASLEELVKASLSGGDVALDLLERLNKRGEELDRPGKAAHVDQSALWERKMIETLTDLICFTTTPDEFYFRDYLLLSRISDLITVQKDRRTYYGRRSGNIDAQIDQLAKHVAQGEAAGLDPTRAWHRHSQHRKPFNAAKARAGRVFASFKSRFDVAIPLANVAERGVLGFSYAPGFSRTSSGIHMRPGSSPPAHPDAELATTVGHGLLTGMHALVRCQELVGVTPPGRNEQIRNSLIQNPFPTDLMSRQTAGRAVVGDKVRVGGVSGTVTKVEASPYGYETYKVRYSGRLVRSGLTEDWHLPQEVRRID